MDENQPIEQAGFHSGYSTIDHIHTVNQLKEKCAEYQKPLCLAFVDYEKAFDSVESKAILTSLEKQGVDKGYIDALAEIQNGASTFAMLAERAMKFPCVKAYGKVIQFHQSYSQQLWKICSVTLNGVTVVFQSMETNFQI